MSRLLYACFIASAVVVAVLTSLPLPCCSLALANSRLLSAVSSSPYILALPNAFIGSGLSRAAADDSAAILSWSEEPWPVRRLVLVLLELLGRTTWGAARDAAAVLELLSLSALALLSSSALAWALPEPLRALSSWPRGPEGTCAALGNRFPPCHKAKSSARAFSVHGSGSAMSQLPPAKPKLLYFAIGFGGLRH